ncbi:MAG: FecR domain-containing protein [bacterium]|nr:FecR domain-containing protein [bacterium]
MSDKNGQTDPRDDIARLVRLAGRRPAAAPERVERVRREARAQWQEVVSRRSRRRGLRLTVGLAAAASLVLVATLWILAGRGAAHDVPLGPIVVEALSGHVWGLTAGSGERSALEPGSDLPLGSELVSGEDGRVAIRLASGHSIRLDVGTALRIVDAGSLDLARGAIYVDSGFIGATAALEVRTPLGTVREIGTQFEVRLGDESVRVRLREGRVVVRGRDATYQVAAGSQLDLAADGSVTRGRVATHGDVWGWVDGLTPMIDIDGRSAREFLDWVSRERGWTLAFGDEKLARAADEVRLSGTTSGMDVEQALEAVMATSRMSHRIENGVLLIEAPDL